MKHLYGKLTGHGSFEVDESFVYQHIADELDEEDREIMNLFVEQSQNSQREVIADANTKRNVVKGAFYRICDVPSKPCDDSPLESIEYPERNTGRKKSVFGHEGQMIRTDGTGKKTKLTKVYKRDDNRGALLRALRRMKLNV